MGVTDKTRAVIGQVVLARLAPVSQAVIGSTEQRNAVRIERGGALSDDPKNGCVGV